MNQITHWINGALDTSKPERSGDVYNPATGKVSKTVAFGNAATVDSAVSAATSAFAEWRHSSLTKRTQVLFAFRELVLQNKEKIAALITDEHGKVLSDAAGEVTRGLEVVEFACGIPKKFQLELMSIQFVRQLAQLQLSRPLTFQPWCRCGSSRWQLLAVIR